MILKNIAMKFSIISKMLCAFALSVSLMSFAGSGEKDGRNKNDTGASFAASVIPLKDTFKVKLAVNTGTNDKLKIILRDKTGKVYYAERFSQKEEPYRKVFDFTNITDGSYFFELYYQNKKLTKEVEIQTNEQRTISLE
jgi:hypothetical protein